MTMNAELWKLRDNAVPRGVGSMHRIFASHADNHVITDSDGNRYIDFASGIAVTNTGHNHPDVKAAVERQLKRFSHVCFQVTPYESYIKLADRLNQLAPGASPKKTIFLTTGAEAVENAIKIARAHTGRPGVIAFSGGFHGRTMLAMALTGKVAPYKAGFGPLPGDVYHLPFPAEILGVSAEQSLEALDQLFRADISPDSVAAIIIEPVQGEGGFYPASNDFLQALRDICTEHGIIFVADEIQSGFARTGRMFAIDHAGIEPDLMTVAKAMAGGFPISGVIGKSHIMDAPAPGGLGGTYGGSPIGCAAGLAVLDIIERDDLCNRALEVGSKLRAHLDALKQTDPGVAEVRGLGAMLAVELVKSDNCAAPDPERTAAIVEVVRDKGVLLLSCGVRGNVIRLLPPLTISSDALEKGAHLLKEAFHETMKPAGGRSSR